MGETVTKMVLTTQQVIATSKQPVKFPHTRGETVTKTVLKLQQFIAASKQPVKSPHTRPALCLQTRCWPIEEISS